MLLLDNNGKIIGFDNKEENKPAPFPIKDAYWDGEKWNYPEIDKNLIKEIEIPPLIETEKISPFDLLYRMQGVIRPSGGSLIKEKSNKISVLIPSYKKEKWVKEAIQSALDNTMKPFEVMVLAMTDEDYNSASEITDPIVKVIKHNQLNASAARNKLVTLCNTEYFIFLDADDLLANNFIETVYNCEASIVGVPVKQEWEWTKVNRYYIAYANLTVLLHKEVWNEIGGLREDLATGGEDNYFLNKIFEQKKWLIDFSLDSYFEYRIVDKDSLFQKNNNANFNLSVEKELYLNKDWYLENLNKTALPLFWVKDSFDDFLKKYKNGNNTGIPLKIDIKNPFYNNSFEKAVAERWNNARHLFEESRMRDTNYVCKDENNIQLYGRKFDVYVFSPPTLNWNFSKNKNAFYVNNPNVDLSLPTEEILKNYSVHFSETQNFIVDIDNTISIENEIKKLKNEVKEMTKDIYIEGPQAHENAYTLAFFSKCNKNCYYCLQNGLDKNLDENTLYENFLTAVNKLESLHGLRWRPILSGGEITLCSDEFAKKIMERLKDYDKITLLTNGTKYKESIFYKYPNVDAYVHLTEPPFDDSFLRHYDSACVIATKKDLPFIIDSIKNGKLKSSVHIPLYTGDDENLKLSLSDIELLNETVSTYFHKQTFKLSFTDNPEKCLKLKFTHYRQVNLWDMTVYPCCGWKEPAIPLEDWSLQNPSGKVCSTCYKFTYG